MTKFNIPDRHYCDGDKKLMSIRLPQKLLKELEALADKKGWSLTDIMATALDQYVQWERKPKK